MLYTLHRMPTSKTAAEILLQSALNKHAIRYETQKSLCGITIADAFVEPNFALYADGDYWHAMPDRAARDKRIRAQLESNGYRVLAFAEHMLHNELLSVEHAIAREILGVSSAQEPVSA